MTCTNFRCPIYPRSGRPEDARQDVGRSPPGCQAGVDRFTNYRPKLGKAPAPISTGLRTTPISLLTGTGAGRFLITSFRRAPPEPRPKCERVHFKQKIRSTPWQIWYSATFGRSTILAGERWICDVGIKKFYRKWENIHNRGFYLYGEGLRNFIDIGRVCIKGLWSLGGREGGGQKELTFLLAEDSWLSLYSPLAI